MDLNPTENAALEPENEAGDARSSRAQDIAQLDQEGPHGENDPLGTPGLDEQLLWKGRPNLPLLARNAFHTRSITLYFIALTILAILFGTLEQAVVVAGLGAVCVGILYLMARRSAHSTLYILTDARLIMRIGMALETRINIPLKQIEAAQLRPRANGHGDIAVALKGERLLGYLLMWPHARPFRLAHPQPMLRAVPDAAHVAELLAQACAKYGPLERKTTDGDAQAASGATPALARNSSQPDFKGAPA